MTIVYCTFSHAVLPTYQRSYISVAVIVLEKNAEQVLNPERIFEQIREIIQNKLKLDLWLFALNSPHVALYACQVTL